MWEEAQRVSRSHSREDLIKRCVESASLVARTCVVDLEERLEKFVATSDWYAVVLKIRAEAAANDPDARGDGGGGRRTMRGVSTPSPRTSPALA